MVQGLTDVERENKIEREGEKEWEEERGDGERDREGEDEREREREIWREGEKETNTCLTRRVHTLWETDFRGHWRVDF